MNVEYLAQHFELTDEIRGYAEKKLEKALKFVEEPIDTHITLMQEKHRHIAEIKLSHRHGVVQAAEETDDMADAINLAADKIEKQVRRGRKKFLDQRRRKDREIEQHHWPVEVLDAESLTAGSGRRVIKRSALPIKPMSVEEAALQLEGSRSDFVVFKDASSHQVSVLYKRRDTHYGLISPEV